jgi:hypothetical protein
VSADLANIVFLSIPLRSSRLARRGWLIPYDSCAKSRQQVY